MGGTEGLLVDMTIEGSPEYWTQLFRVLIGYITGIPFYPSNMQLLLLAGWMITKRPSMDPNGLDPNLYRLVRKFLSTFNLMSCCIPEGVAGPEFNHPKLSDAVAFAQFLGNTTLDDEVMRDVYTRLHTFHVHHRRLRAMMFRVEREVDERRYVQVHNIDPSKIDLGCMLDTRVAGGGNVRALWYFPCMEDDRGELTVHETFHTSPTGARVSNYPRIMGTYGRLRPHWFGHYMRGMLYHDIMSRHRKYLTGDVSVLETKKEFLQRHMSIARRLAGGGMAQRLITVRVTKSVTISALDALKPLWAFVGLPELVVLRLADPGRLQYGEDAQDVLNALMEMTPPTMTEADAEAVRVTGTFDGKAHAVTLGPDGLREFMEIWRKIQEIKLYTDDDVSVYQPCASCWSATSPHDSANHAHPMCSHGHVMCEECLCGYAKAQLMGTPFNVPRCPMCREYVDVCEEPHRGCCVTNGHGYLTLLAARMKRQIRVLAMAHAGGGGNAGGGGDGGQAITLEQALDVGYYGICKEPYCEKVAMQPKVCVQGMPKNFTCSDCEAAAEERAARAAAVPRLRDFGGAKQCPHCEMASVLVAGCKFMYCDGGNPRGRKHTWCWLCQKKLTEDEHMSHFYDDPFGRQCRGR